MDVESASVDVVWRELRSNGSGHASYEGSRSTTLRRERFLFHDVFAGPQAHLRSNAYCRHRVRKALFAGQNLVFNLIAAGESSAHRLEPPMQVLLGDAGGQGLISQALEEVFQSLQPHLSATATSFPGGLMPNASSSGSLYASSGTTTYGKESYLCPRLQYESDHTIITVSILCVVKGKLFDLLHPSSWNSAVGNNAGSRGQQRNNNQQRVGVGLDPLGNGHSLRHHTQITLRNVADYERLTGVLLGRRAALKEALLATRGNRRSSSSSASLPPAQDISLFEQSWITGEIPCTLWTVVKIVGLGTLGSPSRQPLHVHFLCPCGDQWGNPGMYVYH